MTRRGLLAALLLLLCWAPCRAGEAVQTGFVLLGAPPEAEVVLDDRPIGRTPLPGPVAAAPGEHRVRLRKPGYAPYSETFRVYPRRVASLLVEMASIAGVLRLRGGTERARVFVDERFSGETPVDVELLTGPHTVRLSRSGFQEEVFTVNASPGLVIDREVQLRELPARVQLKRQMSAGPRRLGNKWWVWTASLLGAAAVATAVIVPTVYYSQSPCQRAAVEVCFPIHVPGDARLLTVSVPF